MARKALTKENIPVAPDNCILITLPDFAERIRSGTYTARKIAQNADALIRIGRNVYVHVKRVEEYLDALSG